MNEDFKNGSHIDYTLYKFILNNLESGKTILELGSGAGSTKYLSNKYKMYSIEENKFFIFKYNSHYFHIPTDDTGFYRRDMLLKFIKDLEYDMILVDGPCGEGNRDGFLTNLDVFNTNVMIIFDDTHRHAERELAINVGKELNKTVFFKENFAYIK